MLMDEVRSDLFLRRLPPPVLESLTPEQIESISKAAQGTVQSKHPVDVRWSWPLPFIGRAYLVIVFGRDKRSPARLRMDRTLRPADHLSEALLIGFSALITVSAMLIGILFYDAILSP